MGLLTESIARERARVSSLGGFYKDAHTRLEPLQTCEETWQLLCMDAVFPYVIAMNAHTKVKSARQ